jgi:hypothetical protein
MLSALMMAGKKGNLAMTPAELTALEAELRYTAAARAMRHSATTPTGYVEYRAADAIAEQLRENADLRRKLDTAREGGE